MGTEKEKEYTIKYDPIAVRTDIRRLDSFWRGEILDAVTKKLAKRPEVFGKPLRESLIGWRSLRVGDYRVVYRTQRKVVYILGIVHRSDVYDEIAKRLGL